jgi:Raffinose synthase or seed imbibition protein Sip1
MIFFYYYHYSYLRSQGVDGVKVDAQSVVNFVGFDNGGRYVTLVFDTHMYPTLLYMRCYSCTLATAQCECHMCVCKAIYFLVLH